MLLYIDTMVPLCRQMLLYIDTMVPLCRQMCEQYSHMAHLSKQDLTMVLRFFPKERQRFAELSRANFMKKAAENRRIVAVFGSRFVYV